MIQTSHSGLFWLVEEYPGKGISESGLHSPAFSVSAPSPSEDSSDIPLTALGTLSPSDHTSPVPVHT